MGLKPMLGHLDVLDDSNAPTTHGSQQLDAHPGLWFTGMRPRLSGFFHMAGKTAQAIAFAIEAEQMPKGVETHGTKINTATDVTVT
jgi:hypothetical protein